MLILPPTNVIELPKYIPHDSGCSSSSNNNDENGDAPVPTVSGDISLVGSIKEITKKLIGDKELLHKSGMDDSTHVLTKTGPTLL